MYNNSYNEYIRNVLGNTEANKEEKLRYPEEDKSYYCDYSHPKNSMKVYEAQNNESNAYMPDYNIMYSDYQNRYDMQNYYDYGYYPNGYNYRETRNTSEIEECYPEIYGIVYPMVQKACRDITEPVSKNDVEKMVEELYGSLEGNDDINVNITLNNNIDNLNSIKFEQNQGNSVELNRKEEKQETKYNQQTIKQPNRSTGLFKPNIEPKREIPMQNKIEVNQENMRTTSDNSKIIEKSLQEQKETRYCNNGLCDIIRILLVRELLGGANKPNKPSPYPPFGPGPRPPYPPFEPGPAPRPPFWR